MKRVFLDSNFLFSKEVMPFQGNELSYTYPAPNDIPKEIDVTPSQGGNDVAMRFVYGDREEAGSVRNVPSEMRVWTRSLNSRGERAHSRIR